MNRPVCRRCQGSKKIWGEGDNEVPLKVLMELSAENVLPGLMVCPPRECPDCKGTGEETYEQVAAARDRYQAAYERSRTEQNTAEASLDTFRAAALVAVVVLDEIASADCECDASVGYECLACRAGHARNEIDRAQPRFPVLDSAGQRTIAWTDAARAWAEYDHRYANGQTLETLAARGGLAESELRDLLGYDPAIQERP